MNSGIPPTGNGRQDDSLSSGDRTEGPAASAPACLRMLDRVRKRSGTVDADWLFSTSGATHSTDRSKTRLRPSSPVPIPAIIGTPAYMSPEQADGRNSDVDTTSDVYALGVILYELLVGEPPFRKSTRVATLKAIWCDEVRPPSRCGVTVATDLEAICLKCLQKEKADRYSTAAAVAEDLQRFLNREPVTARPIRPGELLIRACRRRPAIAGLTGTAI